MITTPDVHNADVPRSESDKETLNRQAVKRDQFNMWTVRGTKVPLV